MLKGPLQRFTRRSVTVTGLKEHFYATLWEKYIYLKHFFKIFSKYFVRCVLHTCGRGVGEDGEGADVLRCISSRPGKECSLLTGQKQLNLTSNNPPA